MFLAGLLLISGCASAPSGDDASADSSPVQSSTEGPTVAGPTASPLTSGTPESTPAPRPAELPGGGQVLLPRYRLCGYVGSPGAPGQGRLGVGDLGERVSESQEACAPYAGDRQVMTVMELIAVTVMPNPGADGMWRHRTDPAVIDSWLRVAREHQAMLLLDIQPGQSDFLTEVKALEPYLSQPDVGVALDPEWAMEPGQVPMQSFGSTTGQELDAVASYLAELVERDRLPEKVMLYHVLHPQIVGDESALRPHPGVVLIKSVDGIGSPADKVGTYDRVKQAVPPYVRMGFKLFYEEDVQTSGVLMTPEQVMGLDPRPDYVMYE
ncbi:hypothetical protein GCM10009785_21150 [Brooklawnia cerclae]